MSELFAHITRGLSFGVDVYPNQVGIKESSADASSFQRMQSYLAVMIAQVTPTIKRIITCFAEIPKK